MEELIQRQKRYTTVRGVLSFYISTTRLFYILSLICFLASEDHGVLIVFLYPRKIVLQIVRNMLFSI